MRCEKLQPIALFPDRPVSRSPYFPIALFLDRPISRSPYFPIALFPDRPISRSPYFPIALFLDRPVSRSPPVVIEQLHHLRRFLWSLQQEPELAEAFQEVVKTDVPVALSHSYKQRLFCMGLIKLKGKEELAVPRCNLYRQYFSF